MTLPTITLPSFVDVRLSVISRSPGMVIVAGASAAWAAAQVAAADPSSATVAPTLLSMVIKAKLRLLRSRNAIDEIRAVITDQQRAILRHGCTHRPRPRIAVFSDEPRHEVLVLTGRL